MTDEEKELKDEIPEQKRAMSEEDERFLQVLRFNSIFPDVMTKENEQWLLSKFQEVLDENKTLWAVRDGLVVGLLTLKRRILQTQNGGNLRF